MKRISFPENFIWGVASSAYQIEGAHTEDGKGESIWDRYVRNPGRIFGGTTGNVACDGYHLYPSDIALMKSMGVKAFRMSISWPRIFPEGMGVVNQKGIEHYRKVINMLNENGIIPLVTLFHWDLPQKLQDIGGFTNRQVIHYYEDYARLLFSEFGDIVPFWITMNEPWAYAYVGHCMGVHAPGIADLSTALLVYHNIMLASGLAHRVYKGMGLKGEIGVAHCHSPIYPASDSMEDTEAAKRHDELSIKWTMDPLYKGKYPEDMWNLLKDKVVLPEITQEDMDIISTPSDFLGLNNYNRVVIRENKAIWPIETEACPPEFDTMDNGWEMYAPGIYDIIMRMKTDYSISKIIITENGMCLKDKVDDNGEIKDQKRIDYLSGYLSNIQRAIKDGANIVGYMLWTFMDNFEWHEGYDVRFGIVHVDFDTQKRTLKKSAYWYIDTIKNNGFSI